MIPQAQKQQMAEAVAHIRETMAAAARAAGRDPAQVKLCAACKTRTVEEVRCSAELPIDLFGENHVQELVEKTDAGAYNGKPGHFIGHLQTNKVNKVVGRAALIQSVDSTRLLDKIDTAAARLGLVQDILVEINIGEETSKSGVDADSLFPLLEAAAAKENLRLRGLIGISPWTDLTGSGQSYIDNRDIDPSMTPELLQFYAACYTDHPEDPLCSPLFGNLTGLPPSLLFVGGDEVMLDDTRVLHEKLLAAGCRSRLIVAPERWHAYVLYYLNENMSDFDTINQFMTRVLSPARKLRWMRLDNAAKIYPAAKRRNWTNYFRLSATLTEPVDVQVLRAALDVTVRRFPSIAVRLRRGVFWYYLEEISKAPAIEEDKSYPLVHVPFDDVRRCAFRVLVYKNRLAVEFFHAVTDGTGGLIFLKTLTAEYLSQKYGIQIPAERGVLGRLEDPDPEELEDSFLRYAGQITASRKEQTAYHLSGTPEPDGFLDLTTLMLPVDAVKAKAKEFGVSVTEFIASVMMKAISDLQTEKVPRRMRRRPVKVLLPVNLRGLFPSRTLRNFASYVTPEIDPRLGDYSLAEICKIVHYRMGLENDARMMAAKIATNVASERSAVLRAMPLFIKNIAMKAVFDLVGECKSCLCLSNLGLVQLPAEMAPYVTRMDFIIGVQAKAPHNCGVVSWDGTMYINMIRNIREPELESHFYRVLHTLGLPVKVESNQRWT